MRFILDHHNAGVLWIVRREISHKGSLVNPVIIFIFSVATWAVPVLPATCIAAPLKAIFAVPSVHTAFKAFFQLLQGLIEQIFSSNMGSNSFNTLAIFFNAVHQIGLHHAAIISNGIIHHE